MSIKKNKTRFSDFSIEVPAKWVLTGEHAVLRGKTALAFPHDTVSLKLTYTNQEKFSITANPFQPQIRALIGRALDYLGLPADKFENGEIDIQSRIPIGGGLGSSAALCVAISRLVLWKTGAPLEKWGDLATHLEDLFHGKSSGMDVQVIVESQPILFTMGKKAEVLGLENLPRFELYDSGKRGQTRECIEIVKHWQGKYPHLVIQMDDQMDEATTLAKKGLELFSTQPRAGEDLIAKAMNLAQNCFETWGLITPELMEQKHELLKQGALAVKLTGAGLGGFWVALWRPNSPKLDTA